MPNGPSIQREEKGGAGGRERRHMARAHTFLTATGVLTTGGAPFTRVNRALSLVILGRGGAAMSLT